MSQLQAHIHFIDGWPGISPSGSHFCKAVVIDINLVIRPDVERLFWGMKKLGLRKIWFNFQKYPGSSESSTRLNNMITLGAFWHECIPEKQWVSFAESVSWAWVIFVESVSRAWVSFAESVCKMLWVSFAETVSNSFSIWNRERTTNLSQLSDQSLHNRLPLWLSSCYKRCNIVLLIFLVGWSNWTHRVFFLITE